MSVAVYSEWLGNVGLDRFRRLAASGLVRDVYTYIGPDNDAAQANRREWARYRDALRSNDASMWGWYVCSADQERDVAQIRWLAERYPVDGWLLNIEKPLEGADLKTLVRGVGELAKPMRASLAGTSAAHVPYDYRALDLAGADVEWQAYCDSGEGPAPDAAVRELYKPSFVVEGCEYRCSLLIAGKTTYGWGRIGAVDGMYALYDSYRRPGPADAEVRVYPRAFGWTMTNRTLWRGEYGVGKLLGRARYSRIRVALDVTRGAAERRSLAEWTALAASARVPGAARRPVSVYLAEVCPDDVLRAIAEGAG
jgi:hypothetical protein